MCLFSNRTAANVETLFIFNLFNFGELLLRGAIIKVKWRSMTISWNETRTDDQMYATSPYVSKDILDWTNDYNPHQWQEYLLLLEIVTQSPYKKSCLDHFMFIVNCPFMKQLLTLNVCLLHTNISFFHFGSLGHCHMSFCVISHSIYKVAHRPITWVDLASRTKFIIEFWTVSVLN